MIDDDDVAAVSDVLKGDFLTTGPAVQSFQSAFAELTGARHAVVCSSGTTALHLAALALDLGPGDAIVVPSITFLATANAARYVGADVVFSDVDPNTGLMQPQDLLNAIEKSAANIKAVFPVHLAGQSPDMPTIFDIAESRKLAIVEDACHAIGSTYRENDKNVQVGGCKHSNMTVFSFHPVKTIAMGEGGAVTTNNEAIAKRLKRICSHNMIRELDDFTDRDQAIDEAGKPNPWYYEMSDLGFNFRASDIHCALGLSQLNKLEHFTESRKKLVSHYDVALESLAPIIRPIDRMPGCDPAWHLYVVKVDFAKAGISRAEMMHSLREKGIGSQVHYIPVHRQPYYKNLYGNIQLPGADQYYDQCLSLPLFPGMAKKDIERIVSSLKIIIGKT